MIARTPRHRLAAAASFAAILAIAGATVFGSAGSLQVSTDRCPLSQGYWRTHPAAWPVTTLVLGNSANAAHTYSQRELLAIFDANAKKDASLILADQLIAAKLNI